jgi:hypothetical protein
MLPLVVNSPAPVSRPPRKKLVMVCVSYVTKRPVTGDPLLMDHPLVPLRDATQRGLDMVATMPDSRDLQRQAGWWVYRHRMTQELRHLQDTMAAPHVTPFGTVRRRPGE